MPILDKMSRGDKIIANYVVTYHMAVLGVTKDDVLAIIERGGVAGLEAMVADVPNNYALMLEYGADWLPFP